MKSLLRQPSIKPFFFFAKSIVITPLYWWCQDWSAYTAFNLLSKEDILHNSGIGLACTWWVRHPGSRRLAAQHGLPPLTRGSEVFHGRGTKHCPWSHQLNYLGTQLKFLFILTSSCGNLVFKMICIIQPRIMYSYTNISEFRSDVDF